MAMNNQAYRDKIRKLLALAGSSNEHEAKAAMLKARKLMAEHKITEADLESLESKRVIRIMTPITCSKRREPWIIMLSAVIAESYCCKTYQSRILGKQTYQVGFIGFEDDVDVCTSVFNYALDCIHYRNKQTMTASGITNHSDKVRVCNSYGYGFASGLSKAFWKQQNDKEVEWGLIMTTPKEVVEATSDIREISFKTRAEETLDRASYAAGYHDGQKFVPTKRIKGN